jgi:hypothetical protein
VTDYGVRLTVRVGNLSPLACAPFRVFLIYTVSPLQGGRFHRPFQGFSAPRYVSTTIPPLGLHYLLEESPYNLNTAKQFLQTQKEYDWLSWGQKGYHEVGGVPVQLVGAQY